MAIGFTALLNLLLLTTLVWTELLHRTWVVVGWATLGLAWTAAAVVAARLAGMTQLGSSSVEQEDLFRAAQKEYLRGHWFEAEAALTTLLGAAPKDIEARLLLATLLRHTGRVREARQQLTALQRLDGAEQWENEINHEHQLLDEAGPNLASLLSEKMRELSATAATLPQVRAAAA